MMTRNKVVHGTLALGIAVLVLFAPRLSLATETEEQLIRGNALLAQVYRKDPATAFRLAERLRAFLSSAERGELSQARSREPGFRRRGGTGVQSGEPESEMERQNRQVFEENPALRKMYFHSPVAYLRMLSRLRQAAAAAGGKAAAQ